MKKEERLVVCLALFAAVVILLLGFATSADAQLPRLPHYGDSIIAPRPVNQHRNRMAAGANTLRMATPALLRCRSGRR